MNQVINTINNHRSIRSYTDKPIEDSSLNAILKGIQSAPTSINGQQISVIVIKDVDKRQKIADFCGGQPWIAKAPVFLLFVADYHRAAIAAKKNGQELIITESLESIMVSSVDSGIALSNAMTIAESLDLGIVPIGAVRRDPKGIIELLNLPKYVFPVVGLVIGHPDDLSAKKPRLPEKAVIHYETYNDDVEHLVDDYDETMSEYMLERSGGKEDRNWSQTVAGFYKQVYFPEVYPVIKDQGFDNNK